MTGGNSYSTWANNFIANQIAAGFAYVPSSGVRQDPDTGELEQIVGWQTRNVMQLNGPPQMQEVPIWGDYDGLVASGPGGVCDWGTQTLCNWIYGSQVYRNNQSADRQIFNMTSRFTDPITMNSAPNGATLAYINYLESINLNIDAVALGTGAYSILDSVPGLDLPPGISDAADAGIDYFESVRNNNNVQIDQLLQNAVPQ